MKVGGLLISAAFVATILMAGTAYAGVTGPCGNCHTMHNSQDGNTMGSADYITGNDQLLVTDCVGCHSSSTGNTIVNNTPIVYNSVALTQPELAGGNFYWVQNGGGDDYGHNVFGISVGDGKHLAEAPGQWVYDGFTWPDSTYGACANSCHTSLALAPATNVSGLSGCQGCHNNLKHHGTDPAAGSPETKESGGYRFLANTTWSGDIGGHNFAVLGIEDNGAGSGTDDWEQTNSNLDHNTYSVQETLTNAGEKELNQGAASFAPGNALSMGKFCAGCHGAFHAAGYVDTTLAGDFDNGLGGGNPWLRHPSNYPIPVNFENANGSTMDGQNYEPLIPVAQNLDGGNLNTINGGSDQVFCLSCHKAHGSDQPNMLRYDYTGVVSHSGAGQTNGCFFCHRDKDD
ncbi:MAG: hypothetical protein KKB30_09145 [Proteobacteria bacterium]|nr:hypothetical protein [Pseudomonadota bacterium]MBU1714088.1 hypothetical protein [Pseudomonadota bacterium]